MSKYIDAEKLKAEIERRRGIFAEIVAEERNEEAAYFRGKEVAYDEIFALITSLQQEQPAKRGYKDCNGCEYNRSLSDQIGWTFRGCFGGDYNGKPIAEIELCPLKVAAQQEQPDNEDIDKVAQELYGHLYELKRRNNVPTNLYDKQEIINLWKAGVEYAYNHPKQEQPEADLEKEINDFFNTTGVPVTADALRETARHFFELGLNAIKEK